MKQSEVNKLLIKIEDKDMHDRWAIQAVTLILPNGELTNPEIRGFAQSWYAVGGLRQYHATGKEGIIGQGLEGFHSIRLSLLDALLVVMWLPQRRYAIVA